ncbi:DUF2442 domain-containing protein [Devosia sp. FKR38]|uniref:DUF2442 domain-containing protein n=1 Tax=Devosia sp. FKR38 TaxID=2562312 RepID=UPI0010BF7C6A|nr:DUF2442 domain-containing protein [Devosia sp. FKR38]
MSIEADAGQDRSPSVTSRVPWRTAWLEVLPDYAVRVGFPDGTVGVVRMAAMINDSEAGVFASLRDPAVFAQAYLDLGAVTWPGEIDIAPDAMYREIKANGEWVL